MAEECEIVLHAATREHRRQLGDCDIAVVPPIAPLPVNVEHDFWLVKRGGSVMELGQSLGRRSHLIRSREIELIPLNERKQGPKPTLITDELIARL